MLSIFWKILRTQPKKSLEFLMRSLTPFCVYNKQGQTVYTSQRFLQLIQTKTQESSFFDYFSSEPVELSSLKNYWRLALQGETICFPSKPKDINEYIECSLQYQSNIGLMFLTVKKFSHNASICQLAKAYERSILSLFNHPSLATALVSLDGDVIKGNQRFYELLEVDEREAIRLEEFVYLEDRLIDTELQQNLLKGDIDSYTVEKRLIDRNNETIWVELNVSLVDLPPQINHHRRYFVVLLEDITESKKIYNALVRTEGKWKTFILNSLNLFIQTSNTGQIIYASPAVERVLGYEGEELLDSYISDFIHPNDLNEFELALRLWSSGTHSSDLGIECRWKAKSGLWVCLYIQGQRFPLSLEIDGLIIDGCDITDRKFLEAELRASEEKFRFLALNISGVVFQTDSTYTMRFLGDEIQKITGYPATEFIRNRTRPYISIVHPEDVELIRKSMLCSVLDHHPDSVEYRIIHADGRVRWVCECRQGVFSASGKLSGINGVLFDISDRKQAEEDLRRSEAINRAMVQVLPNLLMRHN